MGWCPEFGPQIQEGCEHLMVPGKTACSCAECGAVCKGRFQGCAEVWAAGPKQIFLGRATPNPNGGTDGQLSLPRAVPRTGTSNGKESHTSDRAVPPPSLGPVPVAYAPPSPDAGAIVSELRGEIRALTWKVDRIYEALQALHQATQTAGRVPPVAEMSPEGMVKAIFGALREHHDALVHEIAQVRRHIAADSKRAERIVAPPTDGSDRKEILGHVDARFEWLTHELSQRFVVLGNAVARIERQLQDESQGRSPTGTPAEPTMAPYLTEIDRLTRGLADAIQQLRQDDGSNGRLTY